MMFFVTKKPVIGKRIIDAENSSKTLRVRLVTGSILKRKRVEEPRTTTQASSALY